MDAHHLDALLVTTLPNILYLTNFTGSAAIVVLTADRVHFITDFRYVTAVATMQAGASACPGLDLAMVEGSYDATVAALLPTLATARIGFEAANLTVGRHEWLKKALGDKTTLVAVPGRGLVERAREVKDAGEIAMLREGARRLSRVAEDVFSIVRAGRTERDVALDIDWRIRKAGFERTAFDTIVAAGTNGALPHAHPGERTLSEGDLVVLDFGGVYASYCVDLTRTVSVGPASDKGREVYAAVLDAHDRAIDAVRPGRSRFEIDQAARDTLTRHGLGHVFGHGTGHGLGIEVHEDPRIASRRPGDTGVDAADEFVASGMVFTIEPGAYLPDWGGVRIEDDVLVTDKGVEVLTDVTTELLEL
jgi:Xaa-Pro aminopeptidase